MRRQVDVCFTFSIVVWPTDSVDDVKHQIYEQHGILPENQTLMVECELFDAEHIGNHDIQKLLLVETSSVQPSPK